MDMMDFAIDPSDNTNVYGCSWEEGLLKINASSLSMTPTNGSASGGANSDGITQGFSRIAVGGVTFDESGTLWFTNSYTNEAIHARDRNGVFYDYDFEDVLEEDEVIADIIVSKDGYAWANVITKGLLVFNGNNTLGTYSDDNYKFLTDEEGNGKLPSRDVLCMEEDLDGEVWVGTASGLAIFYSPSAIFEQSNINAEQILIQQDGNTQVLLETEAINCIEIDGSNRKWIGTKNSGAYLLTDDGINEVYHFTEENSPLPANNVYDISINHSNGEVLFATENGILGFFSTATNFDNEMSNVRVYPNPVRPDFEGTITIDGLAYDSNVKITDIQGNILYETNSEGGRAIWSGLLSDGTKPATGVYLIYAGSPDGAASEVRKITFIR
jgi:ligand-binding sensor domain-containing protein